jgi:lysyl-tRNA synthetase class 2
MTQQFLAKIHHINIITKGLIKFNHGKFRIMLSRNTLVSKIAPELYLKRLVVGGLESIYEIGRNFRNEGISTQHNPEFTMIEFYQAFCDYIYMMNFSEKLLRHLCNTVVGSTSLSYNGHQLDFGQDFKRITLRDSILEAKPEITAAQLDDFEQAKALALSLGINLPSYVGLGAVISGLASKIESLRVMRLKS